MRCLQLLLWVICSSVIAVKSLKDGYQQSPFFSATTFFILVLLIGYSAGIVMRVLKP